jgi:transposase-like protein
VSKSKLKPDVTPGRRGKTRWTRAFKLEALSRMDEAETISALADELGVQRALLYRWRRAYQAGGAEALRTFGRRPNSARSLEEPSAPASPAGEQRRIEELERKIGRQQLELDFFRAALRRVREQRLKKGGPGGTPSTR